MSSRQPAGLAVAVEELLRLEHRVLHPQVHRAQREAEVQALLHRALPRQRAVVEVAVELPPAVIQRSRTSRVIPR